MPSGLIQRIPGVVFSDSSLPRLYRDALITTGSKFLFDFCNPACNPNPANAALTTSSTFNNLVPGAPGATCGGTPNATNLAGLAGISFAGGSGGFSGIDFGTSYNLSATNPSFVVLVWSKEQSPAGANNPYSPLLTLVTSQSVGNFQIEMGADGKTPRAISFGSAATAAAASGVGLGVPKQIAAHWRPGTLDIYINGAYAATTAASSTLSNMSGVSTFVGNSYTRSVIYRAYQENLTVSGRTAAAVVAADYAANAARFT